MPHLSGMPSSYASIHVHAVWSTKGRHRLMTPHLRQRLFPYIAGIAVQNGFFASEVGGVEDHVHCLLWLPAKLSVSHAVQLIKGGSSKWIHGTFPELYGFSWQDGFGAFSVSPSQIGKVRTYIQNQEAHHARRAFRDELSSLLQSHGIEFQESDI